MKKMYVKPQAVNVAFVINENIATSDPVRKPDMGKTGSEYFDNAAAGTCNETLYGFDTGLEPGDNDVMKALENIAGIYGDNVYKDLLDKVLGY